MGDGVGVGVGVCFKQGCGRVPHQGGHGETTLFDERVSGGTCVMCGQCCTAERRALDGSDLEQALGRLVDRAREVGSVDAGVVRRVLAGFVRSDVPDERIRATCRVVAERVNLVAAGLYQGPPKQPPRAEYTPFPGAYLGDTFRSEPGTVCGGCGRLFVWWPGRPRRCQRPGCRTTEVGEAGVVDGFLG